MQTQNQTRRARVVESVALREVADVFATAAHAARPSVARPVFAPNALRASFVPVARAPRAPRPAPLRSPITGRFATRAAFAIEWAVCLSLALCVGGALGVAYVLATL